MDADRNQGAGCETGLIRAPEDEIISLEFFVLLQPSAVSAPCLLTPT